VEGRRLKENKFKNGLINLKRVFVFTFSNHVKSKGYRVSISVIALLCFLVPALIMGMTELLGDSSPEAANPAFISEIFVVDESKDQDIELNTLNNVGDTAYSGITYTDCGTDFDLARESANMTDNSLMLVIEQISKEISEESSEEYVLNILLPDETNLSISDASAYEEFLNVYFNVILAQKSGLDYEQPTDMTAPENTAGEAEEASSTDAIKDVFSILLPYLNIMVLYFFVLFYGQGVANSVIMEKTSKLMDTLLLSVKPETMIFGKVLAIALAGVLQIFTWIMSLVLGFVAGTFIVKAINPESDMMLIQLFEEFGSLSGMFSVSGSIVALLIIISSFLLYCSLAAIGGAVAGKPEDLSSTNILFVLALLVSFFLVLSAGGLTGAASSQGWLNWFPFTAVLVVPSHLLLGKMTVINGLGSLAVTILVFIAVIFLAGRIYKMMALYKGNTPSIGKVFAMLKNK
jgi:ABC-type Na+ efflux pump permease subunit